MTPVPSIANFLILFGLTLFFGLAVEELHALGGPPRPGGIRTFPLLGFVGALLYLLEPARAVPFAVGLLILGAGLMIHYWRYMDAKDAEGRPNVTLAMPLSNLLAYVLGPVCLAAPPWIAVGVTVATVLILMQREHLHRFASQMPTGEIVTAGKFLLLTGLILPLLPRVPIFSFTTITPQQVWLAVLAVATMSYGSYLLQRYVVRRESGLWIALLGGMYSSTATTVALARNAATDPTTARSARTGIALATAVMYLRLLVVVAFFNRPLATRLAPALLGLAAAGVVAAWVVHSISRTESAARPMQAPPRNPLELPSALLFAALYVAVSLASNWAREAYGTAGILSLATIVGLTDIDPFVLSLAQGGTTSAPLDMAAAAVLVAASSNNVLKAIYAASFAGVRTSLSAGVALCLLAAGGVVLALVGW